MNYLILVIAAFTFPFSLVAGTIEYTSVQDREKDTLLVRQKTLGTEAWYQCSLSSFSCSSVASTTKLVHQDTPSTAALRTLLPSGASWVTVSNDGHYIAFYIAATQSRPTRTFGVYDVHTGTTYTKDEPLGYWDLLTEGVRIFSFSPDGKTLVYINDSKNHPTLYKVDLESLSGTNLTSSKMFSREYSVADVVWKDNNTILFVANREAPYAWNMYEYTLTTGALKQVASNVSYGVALSKVGEDYLYAEATTTGVRPKIYNPSTRTSKALPIPSVPALETNGKHVTSLKNGLSGVFLLEENKNSDTLLVWLHGGPYRQTSTGYHPYLSYNGYDWALEVARRNNVGVLKIDYPGSMGYGRLFAESISRQVGVKDAQDTAEAIADFAKRNRYSKVYLMGNSYGGYLAMKLLVDNPKAYQGAFTIGGVADWTTMLTQLDSSIFNVQFGGAPHESNYDLYARASIYNGLEKLSTQKVIIMHGDTDMTISPKQATGLSTYLTSIGKSHDLVLLPEEDHVFKKPESFETLCTTTLAFVGKQNMNACRIER